MNKESIIRMTECDIFGINKESIFRMTKYDIFGMNKESILRMTKYDIFGYLTISKLMHVCQTLISFFR